MKGVGPHLGTLFKQRGIETLRDLLFFLPRGYEDRSHFQLVSELQEGANATLDLKVVSSRKIPIQRLGRSLFEVRCEDSSGPINLKWFHFPHAMVDRFSPGLAIKVAGKVKIYLGRAEIVHPEILRDEPAWGGIVPIYSEIDGISSRVLRKVLWEALQKAQESLVEEIPEYLLHRWGLPRFKTAIHDIHFPPESPEFDLTRLQRFSTPAHHRLIYGELFKLEYLVLNRRLETSRVIASSFFFDRHQGYLQELIQNLPFALTAGQEQALDDLFKDLGSGKPMNRLVQADVGAGKTMIALLAAAAVTQSGSQVALMAPTEILAEQHFKNVGRFFPKLKTALLLGKTSQAEKGRLRARLQGGEPLLVIGTHALIEEAAAFSCLDLAIIDEQHRFGVEQRLALRRKGCRESAEGSKKSPHCLVLTATPIPRTLALTVFGDLNVTSIRELPPGRSPIQTRVVQDPETRKKVFEAIRKELESGRQAYFIYPLVNESEAERFTQLKSAVSEAEWLANEVFPDQSVGLLHGQMRADEKEHIMGKFQRGEIRILVSTTVVEVGVDVPNATVMVIEHAERFGLSQLHQLRGRVGRGQFQSYCYLFSAQKGNATSTRLEVLERTSDGFEIAEADLELRGPGEFMGTRQSGMSPLQIANLVRDQEWISKAREDVIEILNHDPELIEPRHASLKAYMDRDGKKQTERLTVS